MQGKKNQLQISNHIYIIMGFVETNKIAIAILLV